MKRTLLALLAALTALVAAGGCDDPSAGRTSPTAQPSPTAGEQVALPGQPAGNRPPRSNPRGPANPLQVEPGDKVVAAGVWVFDRAGEIVQGRVTMVFNAVATDGGAPRGGSSHFDAEVDSGYRFMTAITPRQPTPVVFEVTATYIGGREGDKVMCSIVSNGTVLDSQISDVFDRAPATAHCYVSVNPPARG